MARQIFLAIILSSIDGKRTFFNGTHPVICGYEVPKRTVSPSTRFLFVTGLAGSGFRAFGMVLRACGSLCTLASRELMALLRPPASIYVYGTVNRTAASVSAQRSRFVRLLTEEAQSKAGKLILLNPDVLLSSAIDGYGVFGTYVTDPANGYMNHPNLHVLAALAERAKVDLRVVFLDRPAEALMRTNHKSENVSRDGLQACTLADNAAVLAQQLVLIDRAFALRVVLSKHRAYNGTMWEDYARWLHPQLASRASELKKLLYAMTRDLDDVHHSRFVNIASDDTDELFALGKGDVFLAHASAYVDALSRNAAAEPSESPYFVKKTVFSEKTRFVFIAGLEGTGHHAYMDFFEACADAAGGVCAASQSFVKLLFNPGNKWDPVTLGMKPFGVFVYPWDTPANSSGIQAMRQNLIRHFQLASNSGKLVLLNTLTSNANFDPELPGFAGITPGMVSYPNYNGDDKGLKHVDVHELAYLAEQAGVDLRIVVGARPAGEILVSVIDHRHFLPPFVETAILADDAAALSAQLELVDDAFVMCMPYAELTNVDWWEAPATGRDAPSPSRLVRPSSTTRRDTGDISRAAWLHPDFRGAPLTAAVKAVDLRNTGSPRQGAHNLRFLNATHFFDVQNSFISHLAASTDYLHRSAGCTCGA